MSGRSTPRILVVDDNPAGLYVKSHLLKQAGWNVLEATDGSTGLDLVRNRADIDLAILDVHLPDIIGHEVCRRIKTIRPDIPVLMTSATFVSSQDRTLALDEGADAYLTEPTEEVVLFSQIRALLRIRSAERRQSESEARLQLALKAAELGVHDIDLRTRRIAWDPIVYRLWGIPPGQPVDFKVVEAGVHDDDRAAVRAAMKEALHPDGARRYSVEFRVTGRDDGALRWIHADGDVMFEGGEAVRIVGTVRDVTERAVAQERIRSSEERFRATFENAAVGIAHVAPDGTWLRVNERLCRMLGYEAKELTGRRFQDLTHPDDLEPDLESVRRILAGEIDSYASEKRYLRKDGSPVWARLTVSSLRRPDRSVAYFISVIEDISDRKAGETALRSSEERYRHLFESNPLPMWVYDTESLAFLAVNNAAIRHYGYSAEEFSRMTLADIRQPDEVPRLRALVSSPDAGRQPRGSGWRHRKKDGSIIDVEITSHGVEFDGRLARLVLANDVTERKRAERALRDSEHRLRLTMEASAIGIWDWNQETDAVDWSPECYAIHGVPQGSFEGTAAAFDALVHPDDRQKVWGTVRDAIASRSRYECEFRIVRPDGEVRWVANLGRAVYDPAGEPRRMVGTIADITDRKRAEAALRESEERLARILEHVPVGVGLFDSKGEFLLRNPQMKSLVGDIIPSRELGSGWEALDKSGRVLDASEYPGARALRGEISPEVDFRSRGQANDDRWYRIMAVPMFRDGVVSGGVAVARDITDRKRAEDAIRDRERRFRGIFNSTFQYIGLLSPDGTVLEINRAAAESVGISPEQVVGTPFWLTPWWEGHSDERARIREAVTAAARGEFVRFEARYALKGGAEGTMDFSLTPIRDENGDIVLLVPEGRDITQLKRTEEQVKLLMREVSHRSKNMLSLVQAIARQMTTRDPAEFVHVFSERVQALAASQDLLVNSAWQGVELGELVRSQLAHLKDLVGTRIRIQGAPVQISAAAAQSIGMALHELATNAGKYGALSSDCGRVEITWKVVGGNDGGQIFRMCWREHGGPSVSAPRKSSFGTTVIVALARRSLEADVDLEMAADGIVWTLSCPAANALEKAVVPVAAGALG